MWHQFSCFVCLFFILKMYYYYFVHIIFLLKYPIVLIYSFLQVSPVLSYKKMYKLGKGSSACYGLFLYFITSWTFTTHADAKATPKHCGRNSNNRQHNSPAAICSYYPPDGPESFSKYLGCDGLLCQNICSNYYVTLYSSVNTLLCIFDIVANAN